MVRVCRHGATLGGEMWGERWWGSSLHTASRAAISINQSSTSKHNSWVFLSRYIIYIPVSNNNKYLRFSLNILVRNLEMKFSWTFPVILDNSRLRSRLSKVKLGFWFLLNENLNWKDNISSGISGIVQCKKFQ